MSAFCSVCGGYLDRDDLICRQCGADNDPASVDAYDSLDLDEVHLDRLNPWSQLKHEIIEKYAAAYTTILRKQAWARRYVYVDAFAGAGVAVDAQSDELIAAGALRALHVDPPFSEYHFIEHNPGKVQVLERVTSGFDHVSIHPGDYRSVLPGLLAERCQYRDFARGLCLLDPYGLSVDYAMLQQIAELTTVEIFFNFMLLGANRNVLWNVDPSTISARRAAIMTRVWGSEDWRTELFEETRGLFGNVWTKVSNERVIDAYRRRLRQAGFSYVPTPIAMRNSTNSPLYYLFFCSPKAVASDIVGQIFDRYR